ncbi:MAG TPA: valine--tRNA ligase [Bacteroidota bacterium]
MSEDSHSSLEKIYSPHEVEQKWYAHWENNGLFHSSVHPEKKPYTIVIPPPNVTGVLHMGHILNNTLQDVFIRYARMTGYEACWIPGMDHAGIATQNVVERDLIKQGKTRHDLGRELFLEKVWEWKKQYGGVIIQQLRTLGSSCDWDREKFTMDEPLSQAVQEVFIRLFDEGLIYRGKYIVNWCPKDHTAISDDEVEHSEQQGKLYYVQYPIDANSFATIATTRPETILGDVAIAVHPGDERYTSLVGTIAQVPIVNRPVSIIADDYVDPKFGTGMVKVTPAHDPNDYYIGQRHNLPQLNIFDISAKLNDTVPEEYRGLDRFEARKKIVKELQEQGLLLKIEDHSHSVGKCYRCNTVIEPYLSDQWFVKMKPLAEPALSVVANRTIKFYPERWTRVYEHWMNNIRDWCISRQLWWGHRIPVYYTPEGTFTAARSEAEARGKLGISESTPLRQDEDVLDTWFSSWLWPFSVHNWPNHSQHKTEADLRYYYPTETLVTGPDIIFFWVARMIMAGLKFGPSFTGTNKPSANVPFRNVYFTSIIRDEKGRKMSKSLGNSPEPLDLIKEYGADAVRFTILYLAPLGQDVLYSAEKNEIGRNFANKIWNAARFLLMNRGQLELKAGHFSDTAGFKLDHADLADRWIISRFNSTASEVLGALRDFEINKVSKALYDFLWHDYCDWYLEMVKSRLYGEEPLSTKKVVLQRALDIFDGSLRLLHPFMPFLTEELWQHIGKRKPLETIMHTPLMPVDHELVDRTVESEMSFVQKMIDSIRTIRSTMNIPPSRGISIHVRRGSKMPERSLLLFDGYLMQLARVSEIVFFDSDLKPKQAASAIVEGTEFFIPLEGTIDLEKERERLDKEMQRIIGLIEGIEKKLHNTSFLAKAPPEVVQKEQAKRDSFGETLEKLKKNFEILS